MKQQLRNAEDSAPSVDDQRWLVKGKVLADTKLLKDYDLSTTSNTITMMLKPGAVYPPVKEEAQAPPLLRLNTSDIPPPVLVGPVHSPISTTSFQTKVQEVEFWKKTLDGLVLQFEGDREAAVKVWEQWFGSSKHWLTPSLVAKIREEVDVLAM